MTQTKKCSICEKLFVKPYFESQRNWNARKFCSKHCHNISLKGKPTWNAGKTKVGMESKNGMWKGDKVGYAGLHLWVISRIGHSERCEHCGVIGKNISNGVGRKKWSIQWANKSGDYKRDLNDWIPLCAKCHRIYDLV